VHNAAGGVANGTTWQSVAAVPQLPPGGVVTISGQHCGVATCYATLTASVNPARDRDVSDYVWFDDRGRSQQASGPKTDTIEMSSAISHYKVILRTEGDGGYRYTVYDCTPDAGCSAAS
jgi:hypothetical protein